MQSQIMGYHTIIGKCMEKKYLVQYELDLKICS